MATLILKWPVTEGTGTTLNESINGREMYFATAGSYPAWTTGPTGTANTAITASGSTDSGAYASTDSPYDCYYTYTADTINYTGLTVAARFKRAGTGGGGVLSSFYLNVVDRPAAGNPANPFLASGSMISLYVTSNGYARFGWRAASQGGSASWPSVSGPLLTAGEWYIGIAKIITPASGKLFVNGSWYSTVLNALCNASPLGNTFLSNTFNTQFWTIGTGENSIDAGNYQNFCSGQNRSFYGDVGECRVYCGQLTDDEIEHLYAEMTTTKQGGMPFVFGGGIA